MKVRLPSPGPLSLTPMQIPSPGEPSQQDCQRVDGTSDASHVDGDPGLQGIVDAVMCTDNKGLPTQPVGSGGSYQTSPYQQTSCPRTTMHNNGQAVLPARNLW